jgi:AcrR family transcriptional regulator
VSDAVTWAWQHGQRQLDNGHSPNNIGYVSADKERPKRLTRAETKARTRERLLDAAAEVFSRKGFAGASVDDVAEAAGYTTGALYSNFGGKDALFVELLASRNGYRLSEAEAIVSNRASTPEEERSTLSRFLVEVADTDVDLAALQAEFWLYAIRRPELLEHLAEQFRVNRDSLAKVLQDRAQSLGQPDNVPFDQMATVVLALFQGLVQLRRTDPDLVPTELYGTAVSWMFAGLNKQARERK